MQKPGPDGLTFFHTREVLHWAKHLSTIREQGGLTFMSLCKHCGWLWTLGALTPENLIFYFQMTSPHPAKKLHFFPFFKQAVRVMAWWTHFISSVQLFPSPTRPPRGQMAPKQLRVSQYIWRHSWNDKSDGATSSPYTKPLFRTFSLGLVCYKQNLMCENKIKLSSFTAPRWSCMLAALIHAALSSPCPALVPPTWDVHVLSDTKSLNRGL